MAKVVLENVSKIYPGGVKAVDSASLEISDQEFVVLVGPSGCGKSTTLRMVAGLEEISSGAIFIDGKRVNDVPPKDRDIAMVFQNYALYPHMTVYKNMAFGLELRKYPRAEIDQRVREAAQILGITGEQLQRKPKALSGGQRQRVAVGRAIVRKPKAFLFDEPLSNLDAKMRVQMRAEISKLHDRLKSTMIYVTHDQVEAMTMGDRIVVMKDGLIQQVDDPITLYNNPKNIFVAGFIGSPPMNFFKGTIAQRPGALWFTEQTTDGNGARGFSVRLNDDTAGKLAGYVGKPVMFGSRPEDINEKIHASFAAPDQTAAATVEVVEPMGAEIYLYLGTGSHTFVARVNPHQKAEVGQKLDMAFDMRKSHFFDSQTEQVIV
ncbi:MAG TPA: sn-glycerol-3-phosphate ABC transporter ATP-binding protein UgpC [Verrucomicrobiae bacterium]|nr:sn-glycerol-3-phosphate ABC transporter ATP-binding protein UgpC [Verrucomicrobiae bacterium]